MIDILEGRLFLEKDILKIKHGKYNQNGTECFAIAVYLRGSDVPENAIYRTEPEMLRDLSLIEKAWKAAVQDDSPHSSILEEFQRMQARLDETERKLEEWHAYQKAEAPGKQKSQGKKKPAKEKTTLPRDTAEEEAENADLPEEAKKALMAWLAYKYEKHQPYTKTGFRALITKTQNASKKYSETAVADLIGDCMSSGYQGITWDRLKNRSAGKGRNQFTEFEQNSYTNEELEDIINSSVEKNT